MKNTPAKFTQPIELLDRILQEPELVAQLQNLEGRTLGKIIRHIGLEDAGLVISLATTEQLNEIFDEDLWHSERPGEGETFDAERFALWLEVMLDADPNAAARKVAEMEEDFVAMALARHILVLDLGELRYRLAESDSEDADLLDKALESSLNHEFDSCLVVAKDDHAWDAVLALLTELDGEHSDFLHRVLERCRRLSSAKIESDEGFYHVLTEAQQLESDVADERERRREQRGYVTPQNAAYFLLLARKASPEEILRAAAPDPITRAYFATYGDSNRTHQVPAARTLQPQQAHDGNFLARLLQSTQTKHAPRRVLPGTASDRPLWPIRQALSRLAEKDAALYARRLIELNYLANVLIAGCPRHGRCFRPAEAAQAAIATCNLGLETPDSESSHDRLVQFDMIRLFRLGWSRLYREVVLPVATALQTALKGMPLAISELTREDRQHIADLRADLEKALAAGTPWTGVDQLIILETLLDPSEVYALTTLLAECAEIPDAAEFSGRERPRCKSEFIHTGEQIRQIRLFAETLAGKLAGES